MTMRTKSLMMLMAAGLLVSGNVSAQEFTIRANGGAVYSFDQGLDFSAVKDAKANIVVGMNDEGQFVTAGVDKVPANSAVFVTGTPNATVTPATTTEASYWVNAIKPNLASTGWDPTSTIDGVEYKNIIWSASAGFVGLGKTTTVPANNGVMQIPLEVMQKLGKAARAFNEGAIVDQGQTEVTVAACGAVMLSSARNLDFTKAPENVKAYLVAGFANEKFQIARVFKVPANTCVYVTADPNQVFDVPASTFSAYYVNAAKPCVKATDLTPTETIDGVEFKNVGLSSSTGKFVGMTKATTMPAGKGYVQVPANVLPATAREFGVEFLDVDGIDAEVTGITTVKNTVVENNRTYNLNGQMVKAPTKGLYIQNGRKMLVK